MNPERKKVIRQPVVSTDLSTGKTRVRMVTRKRFPREETNYEFQQKLENWWSEKGHNAFVSALRARANLNSAFFREIGESTELGSDQVEEAHATQEFSNALIEAKKARLDPLLIVGKIRETKNELVHANTSYVKYYDQYCLELADVFEDTFKLTPTKKEDILELLRFSKSLNIHGLS